VPGQAGRFARQVGEYDLGNVFGQGRIAVRLPQGRGIDQRDVLPNQIAEGRLGTFKDVTSEQFDVVAVHYT
jgi:hypothetical protein